MKYNIHYVCVTHIGKIRENNQDNFICEKRYQESSSANTEEPIIGVISNYETALLGVFDGMGGEDMGDVASLLAAKCAADFSLGKNTTQDLRKYCMEENDVVCQYAKQHGVSAMGTTAALLLISPSGIGICNIGDSKIYCFEAGKMMQISVDHISASPYGTKAPLYQCLGIDTADFIIDPYISKEKLRNNTKYLICSDGLTDMVSGKEIAAIISENGITDAAQKLLNAALANGGRDNVTILVCQVKRVMNPFFSKLLRHTID